MGVMLLLLGSIHVEASGEDRPSRVQFYLVSGLGLAVFGMLLSFARWMAGCAFLVVYFSAWIAFVL
jgi:hypothetical protein